MLNKLRVFKNYFNCFFLVRLKDKLKSYKKIYKIFTKYTSSDDTDVIDRIDTRIVHLFACADTL